MRGLAAGVISDSIIIPDMQKVKLDRRGPSRIAYVCNVFADPLKPAAGTFSIHFWMNASTPPGFLPRIQFFTSLLHAAGAPRAGLIPMKK